MLKELKERIIKTFFVLCPEIVSADGFDAKILDPLIDFIEPMISKKQFGQLYVHAFVYLLAHTIVVRSLIAEADGGTGTGAASATVTSSGITSEHEGDLSRSYGNSSSADDYGDDTLDRTLYGKEYKRIRRMCVIGVTTRLDLEV